MDKAKEEKQEADLKEKAKAASTGQLVNHMKQTNRLVTLIVAIWDPGLTNQRLNVIIVKRQVIILGIAGVQPRGLKEYKSCGRRKEWSHPTTSS
jgi:hypothetical protein